MKSIATAVTIASLGAAALAGSGLGAVHHGTADTGLDGFGGKTAHVARVHPIWREQGAVRPLHRVRCATADAGDTSTCWAASA